MFFSLILMNFYKLFVLSYKEYYFNLLFHLKFNLFNQYFINNVLKIKKCITTYLKIEIININILYLKIIHFKNIFYNGCP